MAADDGRPLLLRQGALLGANDVDVVAGFGQIQRHALALRRQPGRQ